MRVRQITGTLIQLTRLRFVNAFLVREEDGFTLVDTTVAKSGDALLTAAAAAGAPIRRIALTHGHGDHVGSLDELRRRLDGEVQVSMPKLDVSSRGRGSSTTSSRALGRMSQRNPTCFSSRAIASAASR